MRMEANKNWNGERSVGTINEAILQVLQDIRDELQAIRRLVECPNVASGFVAMQVMERRGRKKRTRRK